MDEIWRQFWWIVGSGGFGAALGCVFGGVTGFIHWGSGRAAGTFLGHQVAQAFENAGEQPLSHRMRGTLVGATDGFLFLGVVGTLVGLLFIYVIDGSGEMLVAVALGGLLLALQALCFGLLAFAMIRSGAWAVVGLCLGGVGGAFVAALVIGADHLLVGVVPGMVAGTALSFLWRKPKPRHAESRLAKVHEGWRSGTEGIPGEWSEHESEGIQEKAE